MPFYCQKLLLFLGEKIPQHVVMVLSTTVTMRQTTGLIRPTVKYHTAAKAELLSSSSILLLPPPIPTNSNTFSCLFEEIHKYILLTNCSNQEHSLRNFLPRTHHTASWVQTPVNKNLKSWQLELVSTLNSTNHPSTGHESISARSLLCSLHTMSNRAASTEGDGKSPVWEQLIEKTAS